MEFSWLIIMPQYLGRGASELLTEASGCRLLPMAVVHAPEHYSPMPVPVTNGSEAIMYLDQTDVRFDCSHFDHSIVVALAPIVRLCPKRIFGPFIGQANAISAIVELRRHISCG